MARRLRIFLSSPSDVAQERLRANLVVQKLARDYARFFDLEIYLWEHEPMLASGHFQDAIEPPSAADIVILILWSRLGTPLPECTDVREYRGLDGRVPVTGTEWEFEDALRANREKGAPDLLAYRRLGDPGASLTDPVLRAEQERQWTALESFWHRYFEDKGLFLAASAKYQRLDEFDQKLEADLVRLIERRIRDQLAGDGTADKAPLWLKGSPFRGLSAYEFEDAPVFFGRDGATRNGLTRLAEAAARGMAFLLVLGASGSGKSSLARAGLLPSLVSAKAVPGVGLWRRVVMRPGDANDDPVMTLAQALVGGDPKAGEGLPELVGPGMDAGHLARHLRSAAEDVSLPFRTALHTLAERERAARALLPHEKARLVLLIDQLEELFTRPGITPQDRSLFVRILTGLSRSGVVWVVATMRSDLWHRTAEVPDLLSTVDAGARLDLLAPNGAELLEMVRRPAAAAGLSFEINAETGLGLDAVIVRAAAEEPGALPLLSVMLETLYRSDILEKAAREGTAPRMLTFAGYLGLGELKGAIAQRADTVIAALEQSDPDAAASLPHVLRALVTTSAGEAITARPAPLIAFPEGSPERRLVDAFVAPEARLLIAEDRGSGAEIRLAHEALIENWPRAKQQIAMDRRDIETRSRLETLLRRYQAAEPREKARALLDGLPLEEGIDLAHRWRVQETTPLGTFIRDSHKARNWRRRKILASVAAAVFLGVSALAGTIGWYQQREAQIASSSARERAEVAARTAEVERVAREQAERSASEAKRQRDIARASQSRLMATNAVQLLEKGDTNAALQIAMEALEGRGYDDAPPFVPDAARALGRAVREHRLLRSFHVEGRKIRSAVLDGPGERVALMLDDGSVELYSVESGGRISGNAFDSTEKDVSQLAFSPISDRIAVALASGVLRLYDGGGVKRIGEIALSGKIQRMTFRPAGDRLLVEAELNGTTRLTLIDTAAARVIREVANGATAYDVAAKGSIIAFTDKATVSVVNFETGRLVRTFRGSALNKQWFSVNPSGTSIATGDYEGVKIYDARTGAIKYNFRAHQYRTLSIMFSPAAEGDDVLVTIGDDGTIVWSPLAGKGMQAFHKLDTDNVFFLPGGFLVERTGEEGSYYARVWAYPMMGRGGFVEKEIAKFSLGTDGDGPVLGSAKGDKVAVTMANGAVDIVELQSPLYLAEYVAEGIESAGISYSGDAVAAISRREGANDGELVILDGNTLRPIRRIPTQLTDVQELAVDEGGHRIGAKLASGRVQVYEVDDTLRLVAEVEALRKPSAVRFVNGRALVAVLPMPGILEIVDALTGSVYARAEGVPSPSEAPWLAHDGSMAIAGSELFASATAAHGRLDRVQIPGFCSGVERRAGDDSPTTSGSGGIVAVADAALGVFSIRDGNLLYSVCNMDAEVGRIEVRGRMIYVFGLNLTSLNTVDTQYGVDMESIDLFPQNGITKMNERDSAVSVGLTADGARLIVLFQQGIRMLRVEASVARMLEKAKAVIGTCLAPSARERLSLDPAPPAWCIERRKWPYASPEWSSWLAAHRKGETQPLPSLDETQ